MFLTAIAVHPAFSKSELFIHMECVTVAPLREQLAREAAARGKYAPLYRRLAAMDGPRWRVSFGEIEAILGFDLPASARLHRP